MGKRGPQPRLKHENRTLVVRIRFKEAEYQKLVDQAAASKQSLSALARSLLLAARSTD